MPEQTFGSCMACGRTDVPICPRCGHIVPHGFVTGTWIPCSCPLTDEGFTNG